MALGQVFSNTSVSPANSHFTNCFTLVIVYHPGLVQYAKQWPTCQDDSVSLHPHTPKICGDIIIAVSMYFALLFQVHVIYKILLLRKMWNR
jgi:hypothetical protein